jgi:adenosine deaminase
VAGHPITRLLRKGLRVTVNTDARTTSETSITREFELLANTHGWALAEFWQCQKNAAHAAFVTAGMREELLAAIGAAEVQSATSLPDASRPP